LQQARIAAHRTFGAEAAHDLALVASGLSGHLAQSASILEPRRTRRVALLVPPYLWRQKLTVCAFGTEGQHCSVGLFLHNKNSHNLSNISVSVKSPLQSFPRSSPFPLVYYFRMRCVSYTGTPSGILLEVV
jgi:hypothetical protein